MPARRHSVSARTQTSARLDVMRHPIGSCALGRRRVQVGKLMRVHPLDDLVRRPFPARLGHDVMGE